MVGQESKRHSSRPSVLVLSSSRPHMEIWGHEYARNDQGGVCFLTTSKFTQHKVYHPNHLKCTIYGLLVHPQCSATITTHSQNASITPRRSHTPIKQPPPAPPTLVPWGPLMGSTSAFHLGGHFTQMDPRVLARGRPLLRAVLPNCLHTEPCRGV